MEDEILLVLEHRPDVVYDREMSTKSVKRVFERSIQSLLI